MSIAPDGAINTRYLTIKKNLTLKFMKYLETYLWKTNEVFIREYNMIIQCQWFSIDGNYVCNSKLTACWFLSRAVDS